MVINVPQVLIPQVEALMRKEEKRRHDIDMMKKVPYWEIVTTGESNPNEHENLDKIRFPVLVAYNSYGDKRQGILTHGDDGYYLWDCTKQWKLNSQGMRYNSIQELWEAWNFSVLKAKVIGKRT